MNLKQPGVLLALAAALVGHAAWADDPIMGYVKTVQGNATLVHAGQRVQAAPGLAVQVNTVLHTGPQASLGVTLKDNTLLSIGPNTELALDAFLFDPAQAAFKLDANLLQGTLNYVSGLIARIKPQAVQVRTPTGNIGVRGTHFVAAVQKD